MDAGVGPVVRVISPLNVQMANIGRVMSPLSVGIPPINLRVGPRGEFYILNETITQYSESLTPVVDARNRNNGGLPLNHQPLSDSRYFPRQPQPSATPAYMQPQNEK